MVEALRTPIGRGKPGKRALSGIHALTLLAKVQEAVAERAGEDQFLDPRHSDHRAE